MGKANQGKKGEKRRKERWRRRWRWRMEVPYEAPDIQR